MIEEAPRSGSREHTVASVEVHATVEACYAVGIDIEAYPTWVENLEMAEVLERDEHGRPRTARFDAAGLGRMSSYVLAYDYSTAPNGLAWNLVEGDLTREIEGRYVFTNCTEEGGAPLTEVEYELTIDLAVPLPGFVKRRAEDKIVRAALQRFKHRVEAQS